MMMGSKYVGLSARGLIHISTGGGSLNDPTLTWPSGAEAPRSGDIAIIITTWTDFSAGGASTASVSWSGFSLGGFTDDDITPAASPGYRIDVKTCTGSESGSFTSTGIGVLEGSSACLMIFRGVSSPGYCRSTTATGVAPNPAAVNNASFYTQRGDWCIGVGITYNGVANLDTPSSSDLVSYAEVGQSGLVLGVAVFRVQNTGSDVAYDPAVFSAPGVAGQVRAITIPVLKV